MSRFGVRSIDIKGSAPAGKVKELEVKVLHDPLDVEKSKTFGSKHRNLFDLNGKQ